MEKEIRILLNMTAPEDYGQMLKDGFRPGKLSPAEGVFLLYAIKDRLRKEAGGEYPYWIAMTAGERLAIAGDAAIEEALTKAFLDEGIPFTEENYRQGAFLTKRILEIEEISDGMCGYLIRNGIDPTVENLYRLRYEKDERPETVFEHNDAALAWTFPDEEFDMDAFLLRESLTHESAAMQAKWLKEQSLFVSAGNVRLLNQLWELQLPYEVSAAAKLAAESIVRGENPAEVSFFELPGKKPEDKKKDFRKFGNLRESRDRTEEEKQADYADYLASFKNADEALGVLCTLRIEVCADNLSAMEYLLCDEAEYFFDKLSSEIGADTLISYFHKPDGGMILSFEVYGRLKNCGESGVLSLLGELAKRGYFEVPVALGDHMLRLRIRREANRYRVIFHHEETGGIVMNITIYPEGIHALVVGDNEEALNNLRESNLLTGKLQKLFGKEAESTYLFKENLSQIRNFYPE